MLTFEFLFHQRLSLSCRDPSVQFVSLVFTFTARFYHFWAINFDDDNDDDDDNNVYMGYLHNGLMMGIGDKEVPHKKNVYFWTR